MRNKTATAAQMLQPLIRLFVRFLLLFPKPVFLGFLTIIRRVFSRSLNELLFDDCFGRYLALGYASVPVRECSVDVSIPLDVELDVGDYTQRSFYLFGYPPLTGELLKFCDQKTAFFDIGANLGLITLAVGQKIPPDYLFAFEPEPKTFAKLRKVLGKNVPEAHALQIGLSDKDGKVQMKSLDYDSGSASLEIGYLESRMHDYECHSASAAITVDVLTFDTFVKGIDLSDHTKVAFKIDVEGHELAVIRGMREFFKSSSQGICIAVETHKHNYEEVQQYMRAAGFVLTWPQQAEIDAFWSGSGSAVDLVFIRNERSTMSNHTCQPLLKTHIS